MRAAKMAAALTLAGLTVTVAVIFARLTLEVIEID